MTRALLAALFLAPLAALAQGAPDGVAGAPPPVRRVLTPTSADTLTTAAFDALPDKSTFSGVVADRDPDGRLRLLRSVVDGRAQGLWTEWYPTGVVRYLAEWRDGLGEGVWFYMHETGLVRDRTSYRADRAVGPSEGWHANGRKAYDGAYHDNDRVGVWRWWGEDGALDSTRTYPVETGWQPDRGAGVQLFAPGAVSTPDAQEFGLALSPGGDEAFFTRRAPGETQAIYVSRYRDGAWSDAERASFSTGIDESPSFGGDRLYFASRRPGGTPDSSDKSENLWVVSRMASAWGDPRPVTGVNRPHPAGAEWPVASELHPVVGPGGALYYWTQGDAGLSPDLYRAAPSGDGFAAGIALPAPVNTTAAEASPAIGPDGVLVFQAYGRAGSIGREDLFASWPDGRGWTAPVPLPVNTPGDELLPSFSADGRTLFFASDRGGAEGAYDLYHVEWASLGLRQP